MKWTAKWITVTVARLILIVGFLPVMAWTIAERLFSEARSTLYLIRCDLLEGLHYFRRAWQRLPIAVALKLDDSEAKQNDEAA